MHKHLLSLIVVTASAVAQSYTISPSTVGAGEGSTNNTFPWSFSTGRYQQVHGDLRGNVRTITALSLRRDTGIGAFASSTARTIDAEFFMADSDYATASSTFASNYAGAAMNVVTRKMISLPDWTAASPVVPAAFNFNVPLDTPFVHTGVKDLVWEVLLYSNTATGTYITDAHQPVLSASGTHVSTGSTTGCLATGRTSRMSLTASQSTNWVAQTMTLSYFGSQAPASAASSFLLGLVNPNLVFPALCTNIYVDQLFLTINATASATGSFSSGTLTVPYNPLLVGFKIHAQGASLDAGQILPLLPVALTNGLETTFAAMPPAPATGDKVARIYSSTGTAVTTGSLGVYFGLVTRFTH